MSGNRSPGVVLVFMKTNIATLSIGARFSMLDSVYLLEDKSPRGLRRYMVQVLNAKGERSKFSIQDTDLIDLA